MKRANRRFWSPLWMVMLIVALPAWASGTKWIALSQADEREDDDGTRERRIADAIEELKSGDPVARELAVTRLIELGGDATHQLARLIDSNRDPLVSLAAQRAFGAIVGVSLEQSRLIRAIILGLDMEEEEAITRGAIDLWRRGQDVVRFVTSRDDTDEVPASLSRRLRVIQAVANLAAGENLRDNAALLLRRIGDPVVDELRAVARCSESPEAWRVIATERLLVIGGPRAFETGLDLIRGGDVAVRAVAVPYLCQASTSDRFAEVVGVIAAGGPLDPVQLASVEAYADRVSSNTLRECIASGTLGLRQVAARMSGRRRDSDARPNLTRLVAEEDERLVEAGLLALGKIGDDADVELIREKLANGNPRIRRAAISALGDHGSKGRIPWIAATLADGDASVRARAALTLADTSNERAIDPLIALLDDEDANVLAAATQALRRLTSQSFDVLAVSSDFKQRRESRDAWRKWWEERFDDDSSAAEKGKKAPKSDLALPLAGEGARILEQLVGLLHREFRPYGHLKEENRTEAALLVRAAVKRMLDVVDREAGPDHPAEERLRLDRDGKEVLRHLLVHGRFGGAGELARMVGSLPIEMEARDYILLVHEASDAVVDSLGDRFTRLSILSNASGEVDEKLLPSLFGKQESSGLMLRFEEGGGRVEFVLAGSPGERAGLQVGDRILSINGDLAVGMEPRDAAKAMRETAELLVLRDGWSQPVSFEVTPEIADPEAVVTHEILPGKIGYLRLRQFEPACAQKVEWALRAMEKEGIVGLVFDLRNNPGGTVLDASTIVDKFVPKGKTLTTTWINSNGDASKDYVEEKVESTDSDTDRDYPLAVLVNRCSASASEMTSGALQDLERGVIVGRRTWGKGIGQNSGNTVRGFTRKSLFGEVSSTLTLSITVLEYFLPTGRSIQGVGVEPDIAVSRPMLMGERFELVRRVRASELVSTYLDQLIENDLDLAQELAHYDGWDPSRYPDFDALDAELKLELSQNLVRHGVRMALRDRLSIDSIDVQEDEDVRAAITALAEKLDLDLYEIEEYEDLAP